MLNQVSTNHLSGVVEKQTKYFRETPSQYVLKMFKGTKYCEQTIKHRGKPIIVCDLPH